MRKLIFLTIVGLAFIYGCSSKILINESAANSTGTYLESTSDQMQATPQNVADAKPARRGEVLFLGNVGKHHDAGKYAPWLAISLFKEGINTTYTTDLNDLNNANLNKYDGLIIYANHDSISPSQEAALKSFVEGGKGLIPLHAAAGCFRNSDWYINAIGGQYKSETKGVFSTKIVNPNNPIMQGLSEFESWDEKYIHQRINKDMTLLMERVEGENREPWTWTRNQGKGRVFYTAYGHNDSTWTKPNFMKLVNNGVLWAIGDEVKDQIARLNRPNVDIYNNEIKGDFTKRHIVPKIQVALSPEESMKLTQVAPDFEVKLFASEPDISKPIAMSWDEKGRLWVVETIDYPNTFVETDGATNDRIKICEDTNGDGKADKFTVFADKLNIPTGIVFANGGVIIAMAPHFVFLKDTNGDDKADVRENIMTGWDKGDTHFGPSNLQYGFDNKIWGVVGSGFTGTTKDGKSISFRTGVYHLNADGTGVEFLANTSNNTWGLGLSEDNNVFISTANNTHSAFYSMSAKYMQRALPNAANEPADGGNNILPVQKIDGHYDAHTMTPNLRQVDVVGGFTSAAGHHLYTARNFPKKYWNRMGLVCEPTVRVLHNAIIEPKGAGFVEKDDWNLLASSDEWFAPVHAEVGPDGAVWIADWYNFVIQHNTFVERQAPSEMVLPYKVHPKADQPRGQGNALVSPLRDSTYARIYRVVYKNAKPYTPIKLSKTDLPGLLAALENDNMFWRMQAQRLIVESKNLQAIPSLYKIINNKKVDEIGLNSPAVHALWTLQGLGALNGSNAEAMQVAIKALSHPAAGVRKAAVQVLPNNQQSVTAIQTSGLLNDPNLNTRLAAVLAVTAMSPSQKLGELIYTASLNAENGKDEWISKALLAAAITHEDGFRAAATKASTSTAENPMVSITDRINKALSQEIYVLPRRGTMLYPPEVMGKEIIIKATISKAEQRVLQGVIVAQGGKEAGYGIYIKDGKLNMAVNQGGKTYLATSTSTLPDRFEMLATLSSSGEMILSMDGKEVAKAKAVSLFKEPLVQGLRTSQDFNNESKMGDYEGIYALTGNMQNASIELKRVGKLGAISTTALKTAAVNSPAASVLKPVIINIKIVENVMKFSKKLLTVKAGQKVTINVENPDVMQHNMVIIKPGTLPKVGAAADALARDPNGAQKQYVPGIPEVLFSTKLINPGEDATLQFTAPTKPGDYIFVCTFPGHWSIMNGILRVTK